MTECRRFGRIEVRPAERLLLVDDKPARVGARAFDLLVALAERRERVVSKRELLDLVWPGLVVEENNLQVHICTLRKLLGAAVITTIPGRGYRFTQVPGGTAVGETAASSRAADAAAEAATGAQEDASPRLISRDEEQDILRALILVNPVASVAGASGVAKTTLARSVARRSGDEFDDAACLVELAPVNGASLVANGPAKCLHVKRGNKPDVDAAGRAPEVHRRILLALDNCEHLLLALAALVEALREEAHDVAQKSVAEK
jgi:DNA-binding winged helix-turn-helix (wHTH) protein